MKALLTAGLLGAALIAAPGHAALVSVIEDNGNSVDTSYSGPGVAAIDIAFNDTNVNSVSSVVANVEIEQGDLGSPLALNGLLDNFGFENFEEIRITLDGAMFSFNGSVVPAFSNVALVGGAGNQALRIFFDGPGEPYGVELGNTGFGGTDFGIDISGLNLGDSFNITYEAVGVPAPAAMGLMLLGMGGLAAARRRKA